MSMVERGVDRRDFLRKAVAGASAVACYPSGRATGASAGMTRRMKIDLCCGRVGVRAKQREVIGYAERFGFESVEPLGDELAGMTPGDLGALVGELKEKRLVWGAGGLPVDFRGDEARFQAGLVRLRVVAPALQRAGVTRVGTWLSPSHAELAFEENFELHVKRLREIARVLGASGVRFGLEYVGPRTSWTAKRYPFVHTMAEARKLVGAIGEKNVGLVLDSWHWYTAHETREDLLSLTNADIIAVDLNDAPAGVDVDAQIDSVRDLPLATGVIDVATFLNALNQVGYDGPVRAEPFSEALRKVRPEEALAATAAAMKRAFALIG